MCGESAAKFGYRTNCDTVAFNSSQIRQNDLDTSKALSKLEGVFFLAASCKKDTIFGAARKFFGPSYFVTALVT